MWLLVWVTSAQPSSDEEWDRSWSFLAYYQDDWEDDDFEDEYDDFEWEDEDDHEEWDEEDDFDEDEFDDEHWDDEDDYDTHDYEFGDDENNEWEHEDDADWEEDYDDEFDWEDEDDFEWEDYWEQDEYDDYDDEGYEFDLDEEKEELRQWAQELLVDIQEEWATTQDLWAQIQSILSQIDQLNDEESFFDLVDQLIEIEEELFGFEDMYEDGHEIDDEWIEELSQEFQDIARITGVDFSSQIDALGQLGEDDYDTLEQILDEMDEVVGEDNVDVEKYYTDLWITELQEIFSEEWLTDQENELATIRTSIQVVTSIEELDRIHTDLIHLEQQVFDDLDYEEEDFDLDEGKEWVHEWIDEVIEYLQEIQDDSSALVELQNLKQNIASIQSHDALYDLEDQIIEIEDGIDWWDDEEIFEELDFEEEKEFAITALQTIISMAQQDGKDQLVSELSSMLTSVQDAQDLDRLFEIEDEFWELEDEVEIYVDRYFEEVDDEYLEEDLLEWTWYIDDFLDEIDEQYDVTSLQGSLDELSAIISEWTSDDLGQIAETLLSIEDSIDALLQNIWE